MRTPDQIGASVSWGKTINQSRATPPYNSITNKM